MANELPEELLSRIAGVTNKRARFVLDRIVAQGSVTTEEINAAGYDHPPRAAQDVRDLGFRLRTTKVKHSNGRSIAAYLFDQREVEGGKEGRRLLPKKDRELLIQAGGSRCNLCGSTTNLQIDHRIPYAVAGESQSQEGAPYQVLCGSCNRKKSWACEHCENWLKQKLLLVCGTCYWAEPTSYEHVSMHAERRVDVVWTGDEVQQFEDLRTQAERKGATVQSEIKTLLTAIQRGQPEH